jgi:hypothetical protein
MTDHHLVVIDIETAPLVDVDDYLETVNPPANYKDQAKIDAYCQEARHKQVETAALDPDLCRLVAFAYEVPGENRCHSCLMTNNAQEVVALDAFWASFPAQVFVGFGILDFDLPVLLRRSLYLGINAPKLELGKYRHPRVIDIKSVLSHDGLLKWRSKDFYCKRFGINVDDPMTGADVGAAIERGDYEAVRQHCVADVKKELLLARRIGIVLPDAEVF